MDYNYAQNLATDQQLPIRRSSWPQGRHVRHHADERVLRMHEAGESEPKDWRPDAEDNAAQDWEQYMPQQQGQQQEERGEEQQ